MRLWLLIILFLIAAAGFAVASMPLSFALNLASAETSGLRYSVAEGTIWKGRLRDARMGKLDLGTVDLALAPSALFRGRAEVTWRANGRSLQGTGIGSASLDGTLTLINTRIVADLAQLPTWTPMDGAIDGTIRQLRFGGSQGCAVSDAQLRAQVRVEAMGEPWTAPALNGTPRCEGQTLVVPLNGRDGANEVDLAIALAPNGTYNARLTVATGDQKLKQTMETMGFERKVDGHEFVQGGRWGLGTGLR